jgi:hypothetical protein
MGKHKLDGGGEVDVTSVTSAFSAIAPRIEGLGRDRVVTFSQPTGTQLTAVKFKFKATGNNSSFMFGIKQICTPQDFQVLYAGLKDIDGSISLETKGFNGNRFLDISPASLTVLFDARNFSTGATANAPHAPFYSEKPALVRPSSEVELGIVDGPGETFRMELQNGATDRPNFLDRVKISSEFVTALVAVKLDGSGRAISHTPLEGVRWRIESFANVIWNGNTPTLTRPTHQSKKVGDLPTISSDSEFDILRNVSLAASDCIVQKFNDGLFSARGQFEAQNFSRPTGHLTVIGSKGVVYIQFPVVAN